MSGNAAENGHPQLTLLAWNNSTLFTQIRGGSASTVKRLFFVGGWKTFYEQVTIPVLDLCHLHAGNHADIKDGFVRRYASLEKLRFVVKSQDSVDWMVKLEIYDVFGQSLPNLLNNVQAVFVDCDHQADVIFSTVHKAKGLGWPCDLLLDDFRY